MENDWIVEDLRAFLEVLEQNCLDESVLLTGQKVLLTESGIHCGLETCVRVCTS